MAQFVARDPNKRAAAIAYDSKGRYAFATAIKWADGTARVEDSGGELPDGPTPWPKTSLATASLTELQTLKNDLVRHCAASSLTQYASNLQQHAEADAVALAQTL